MSTCGSAEPGVAAPLGLPAAIDVFVQSGRLTVSAPRIWPFA